MALIKLSQIEPFVGSDANYVHVESIPSASWVVTHNLAKNCSVTVVDSAGSIVVGEVVFDSLNQVTINFNSAFSGKAYFN